MPRTPFIQGSLYSGGWSHVWATWATSTNDVVVPLSGALTSGSGCFDVWGSWTSQITTTSNSTTVWARWFARAVLEEARRPRFTAPEEPAVVQRRIQQEVAYRAEQQRLQSERDAANAKAEELLRANLSEAQRAELDRHNWFLVVGKTGEIFRIRRGRSGNVDVIDPKTGSVVKRLCAHPNVACPDADTMLAQKLHLEDDPTSFVRIANDHGRPYQPEVLELPPRLRLVA